MLFNSNLKGNCNTKAIISCWPPTVSKWPSFVDWSLNGLALHMVFQAYYLHMPEWAYEASICIFIPTSGAYSIKLYRSVNYGFKVMAKFLP